MDQFAEVEALSYETVEEWLVVYLSRLLKTPEENIDINQSFESYGMDSASVIGLTGDLTEWSGLELEETVVYNHGNIAQLARYVSGLSR